MQKSLLVRIGRDEKASIYIWYSVMNVEHPIGSMSSAKSKTEKKKTTTKKKKQVDSVEGAKPAVENEATQPVAEGEEMKTARARSTRNSKKKKKEEEEEDEADCNATANISEGEPTVETTKSPEKPAEEESPSGACVHACDLCFFLI